MELTTQAAQGQHRDGIEFDWSKASIAFSIGGSSIRCYGIDARGEVDEAPLFEFSWGEYLEQIQSLPSGTPVHQVLPVFFRDKVARSELTTISKSGDLFLEYLALSVGSGLASRGISPENIHRVGISVTGIVEERTIKPNNVAIRLSEVDVIEDIPSVFSAVLSLVGKPFKPDEIVVLNDSEAAIIAELNSHHGGLKEGTGASLIMGTGFNGQLVINHEVDPRFRELGYTMLVNSEGEVVLTTWDKISGNKHIFDEKTGKILSSPSGYRYIENFLAGIGLSVSFFDYIVEKGKTDLMIRSAGLWMAFKKFEKKTGSLYEKVSSLSAEKKIFDRANCELTRILNEDLDTELGFEVKGYFEMIGAILGNGLKTLKKEAGCEDLKFVFSGSVAENTKGAACFWDAVAKAAGSSPEDIRHSEYTNGGVREAYAFSEE